MPSPIVRKMETASKKIKSLLPSVNGGFLTNKWILYLVLFAALFDVFHFYQRRDLQSVMILFLVGILVSFFSKNMVVILILALVVTHLIRYGKKMTEGFEEGTEEVEPEEEDAFDNHTDEEKTEKMTTITTKPAESFSSEVMENLKNADTFLSQMDKKDKFSTLDQAYSLTTPTLPIKPK